ncbi:MAG: amino acid adenylation domain-containing protein [Anaeromyxobacteraceae bacterium]
MRINVVSYLEEASSAVRDARVAIIDGDRTYTFAEVKANAKRCATLILRRHDATGTPIAVFLPKSAQTVFADLGIVYSGNAYTNLDVKSPVPRLQAILRNIEPALVVTSRGLIDRVEALGFSRDRILLVEEAEDASVAHDEPVLLQRLDRVIDTDPLCIINTSGSTGIPKGVALTHRGTIDFMDWVFDRFDWGGEVRIGSLSPFYFDIYTLELFLCLARGATLVIIPDQLAIFPAKLMAFLQAQAITFVFWVPTIMVNISHQDLLAQFPLPSLSRVFFAGEVFPTKHLNRWRRALPGAQFVNLYGPIEIHVDCTYFVVDRDFDDSEPIPIGFPCRNTDVLILNEKNQRCGIGEPGELCIRGSSLGLGYWNDREKTARAFAQNPLQTHYPELIYRTGDLVRTNERGEIMFIGRNDFQIKHQGYRIELPEIEHQVLAIDGIVNACVLYNKDAKEITLFYQAIGEGPTTARIREELLKVLPKYMLPTAFHRLDEMPRNPNGKIDRNGLAGRIHGKGG